MPHILFAIIQEATKNCQIIIFSFYSGTKCLCIVVIHLVFCKHAVKMTDKETFLFSSESVGQGHPGKSLLLIGALK